MQFKFFTAIMLAGVLFMVNGCSHEHSHNDSHPNEDNEHAHAPDGSHIETTQSNLEPLSFTVWTDVSELFVEFVPLILDNKSRFAAHFSNMKTFKAVNEGTVIVRLAKNGKTVQEDRVNAPSSPGIFRPSITPKQSGVFDLEFILETSKFSDKITLSNIKVYSNENDAIEENPPEDGGSEISYLKEQAWKTEFAIAQVKRQKIHEVIRTSGEIQPVKGEEKIVSAKSGGLVFYKNPKLNIGREIRKGETLFSINSQGLLKSNIAEKFQVAKAKFEEAKANFERTEHLLTQQIIGQKEYEKRKMSFVVAEAEWQTLSKSNIGDGQKVIAPLSGIIKNIMIRDGEFAEEGSPLIEITNTRRLILHADVSQEYLPILSQITSAYFKTPYIDEIQSIIDYNGKLVSFGKVMEKNKHFLPVWFELDNVNNLVPGSFVEIYLLTKPLENQLVIPNTALMQDYNVQYIYVQTSGESFEKREVHLGIDDSKNVQILSGISEGEWVVTKGAYQIKMASMSSTIPAHGHVH